MKTTRSVGHLSLWALALTAGFVIASCGDDGATTAPPEPTGDQTGTDQPVIDPGDGGNYQPDIDPAAFVDTIDNPYLPLAPGNRWLYEEINADGETERIEVVVTDERKQVMGIAATVVHDTVMVDGQLIEDTRDWYAQDREGNVWYLGEDVDNYEDGELVDHEGSFEAGVDGALPGIVMLADPAVGDAYRQEFYEGEAEDMGEVVRLGESVSVPFGDFTDVLVTRDWNPLEPDIIEEKYYAPGVGLVQEQKVAGEEGRGVLVEATLGS